MEVEREKKDKLASARKKLNEYKLNRSSVKSNVTTSASSKPADVPLFYHHQNLNSHPTTFNIFNPAAAVSENNNVFASAMFSPVVAENQQIPISFENSVPLTDRSTEGAHSDLGFQNQHQQPNAPLAFNIQDDNISVLPSPFSPPTIEPGQEQVAENVDSGDTEPVSNNSSLLAGAEIIGSVSPVSVIGSGVQHEVIPDVAIFTSGVQCQEEENVGDGPLLNVDAQAGESIVPVSQAVFGEPAAPAFMESETSSTIIANSAIPLDSQPIARRDDTEFKQNEVLEAERYGATHPFASSLFSSAGSIETDSIFNTTESHLRSNLVIERPNLVEDSHQNTSRDVETGISNDKPDHSLVDQNSFESEEAACELLMPNAEVIPTFGDTLEAKVVHDSYATSSVVQDGWNPGILRSDSEMEFRNYENPSDFSKGQMQDPSISENAAGYLQMKSLQEALELQIEELRRENNYLVNRHTELTSKIEESEKLAHEFKLDRDRIKEESMTTSQALRARINSLCEENQRIVKNSTDVGVDLRARFEEKTRQLEEMQKAVIIVSQSKMDFAGRLDHELERVKELQNTVHEQDEEIRRLRTENNTLTENLKLEQKKDAVIQQLQDQSRHFQVQCDTLQKELIVFRQKSKVQEIPQGASSGFPTEHAHNDSSHSLDTGECHNECGHVHDHRTERSETSGEIHQMYGSDHNDAHCHDEAHSGHSHDHSHSHDHEHGGHSYDHEHGGHSHDHEHGGHSHDHDHGGHSHDHDHGGHSHDHDHGGLSHDHHVSPHDHHDCHEHHPSHTDENVEVVARPDMSTEVVELKKTLHRLQWENSSFRNELDLLAVDAKQKRSYEEKCTLLETENDKLRKEVEQLEHVVIQLQGENDTIGDYITLYQTQKLALKECAKEKDAQLEILAKEREMLLRRLAELSALVKDLRDSKSEAGSQCAEGDDHVHSLDLPIPNNKHRIEGQIRDLLTEISSSTLIENFHPCAVCSGRLMTV